MVRSWPIPDNEFDKLCLFSNLLFNWLPDSKYRIMLRKHNNAIGAIIEDTNFPKNDSQYGRKLPWMVGYVPNDNGNFTLEKYQEPRKRKVPNTGDLQDTIISMNDAFIICARNSRSLNDEKDDNFTWEISENESRQVMQIRDYDNVQKITISDLTDKVDEYRLISTNLRTQAETFGREVKKLQEKSNYLQQRNIDLEDQVSELYRQNKLLTTNKIRDESMLHMQGINAEELGTVQGMDKMQLIEKAANDFTVVMKSFSSLYKTGESQTLYNDLVKKMGVMLENYKEEMKKGGEKKATPRPTPTPKEDNK